MEAVLQRDGILLIFPSDQPDGPDRYLKLPDPDLDDEAVADVVALRLAISPQQLACFGAGGCRAVTTFGSAQPDKLQNEDFALAGLLSTLSGPLTFGIVADGVSLRTFWAARGSRIAAFAAYETLADLAAEGWRPDKASDVNADRFVNRLCDVTRRRLSEDRDRLLAVDAHPAAWDAGFYHEVRHRSELWYQTTLIITILGEEGGWFIYCGDGGAVRFLATDNALDDGKLVLASSDDVRLRAAVTINVEENLFTRRFVQPAPPGSSLHFILSSDGFDRSIRQRSGKPDAEPYAELDLGSLESIRRILSEITQYPDADQDNMSLVYVCFPPDAAWPQTANDQAASEPEQGQPVERGQADHASAASEVGEPAQANPDPAACEARELPGAAEQTREDPDPAASGMKGPADRAGTVSDAPPGRPVSFRGLATGLVIGLSLGFVAGRASVSEGFGRILARILSPDHRIGPPPTTDSTPGPPGGAQAPPVDPLPVDPVGPPATTRSEGQAQSLTIEPGYRGTTSEPSDGKSEPSNPGPSMETAPPGQGSGASMPQNPPREGDAPARSEMWIAGPFVPWRVMRRSIRSVVAAMLPAPLLRLETSCLTR